MTDLYHPLYWVGSAAFMLAGGLIGYSIGFRGGIQTAWREAIDQAAKLACQECGAGRPLSEDGKRHVFSDDADILLPSNPHCWSIKIRALKGGRP